MSINHYSLELPETTPYWATQHQNQPAWLNSQTTSRLNENDDDDDIEETTIEKKKEGTEDVEEKEAMFEKPLTPSDVGKLNRLVIPKQHAEKYFPLGSDSGECKGLLLSFEDESGKCWRFRYSYWNSSQSYVLTKGWSRYVKEKRLDAGDVVLFQRFRYDSKRLFIGWRRRDSAAPPPNAHVSRHGSDGNGNSKNEVGGGVGWTRGFYSVHHPYPAHHHPLPYQHDCPHAGSRGTESQKQRTKPVGNSSSSTSCSSSRVLRLFGVNMECQPEQHDHNSGVSTTTTTTTTTTEEYSYNNLPSIEPTNDTHHFYPLHHHHQPNSHSPNPHHMVRHQPYYY